jgi:hypothetical protein
MNVPNYIRNNSGSQIVIKGSTGRGRPVSASSRIQSPSKIITAPNISPHNNNRHMPIRPSFNEPNNISVN